MSTAEVLCLKKFLILPGDGIGPEIVNEAEKVLHIVSEMDQLPIEVDRALVGGAAIDATGGPLPEETMTKAQAADAILLGAVGGPKWDQLDRSHTSGERFVGSTCWA